MMLPRWTTWPALGLMAALIISGVPRPVSRTAKGAAERARAGEPVTKFPRLVVLGIDGMDPDILREVVERHPEGMKNFRRLIEEGQGVLDLGTSTPPQSPVAWSNFITGRNPGGHGVFDFIHRSRETYAPIPATVTEMTAGVVDLPLLVGKR